MVRGPVRGLSLDETKIKMVFYLGMTKIEIRFKLYNMLWSTRVSQLSIRLCYVSLRYPYKGGAF